jgi:F-type H+-transporting ATPase subunit gamma
MPNLKSIKSKISSIKNTRQITKAMKMVAGSKLKRSQSAMNEFKPYISAYSGVIQNISDNTVLYSHPFYGKTPEIKNANAGIIIISSDRGLCGSFNMNLFKLFFEERKDRRLDSKSARLYILGKKGFDFLKKNNYEIAFNRFYSEDKSVFNISAELTDKIVKDFTENKISEVYIISNHYISTLHQKAETEKILPFEINSLSKNKNSGGYLIEPLDKDDEILGKIFINYIQFKIYFKIIESFAGEQASRMNAMDNATRNAGKLINKLTASYNKARQAAVTLEILDIINGVNAIK